MLPRERWRIILASLAGGTATNAAMLVTNRTRFLGFKSGFLLDPRWQSPKLMAGWTQIEPLPLAAVELSFWAVVARAEALAIVGVVER